jgi:ribosomal protein L7/L12
MLFKKIARLAAVAVNFPEFEDQFKLMIHELSSDKPNPKKPTAEELRSFKRDYETSGKLTAVKNWKNHYNTGLIDAKHAVEDWAARGNWQRIDNY